jgi:hypothetical protein
MFSRHLKTIALILCMLIGYGVTLIPLLWVRPHLQVQPFVGAFLIWFLLFILSLPFFLRFIVRKAWFFKGNGEPVIRELLESLLLEVNEYSSPVQVQKKRGRLLFSWRCREPEWCERMALSGVRKNYELKLIFNHNTRTINMIDRVRSVNFDLCPIKVKTGFLAVPRLYSGVKFGPQWGLKNFKETPADQYTFEPHELKLPIVNTIIANGWNVQLDLF